MSKSKDKSSVKKNKKTLFEDDQPEEGEIEKGEESVLKINKEFASRFEHNKRRELLEKGKEIFGEKALDEDEEDESSSEDEDDDADLINPIFEKKFIETLTRIRNNDPKLKDIKEDLFKEEDFDLDANVGKGKSSKQYTYKDQIRDDVLNRADGEGEEGSFEASEESEGEGARKLF